LARYRETGHGAYLDSGALLDLPALHKSGEEIRIEMSLTPISPTRDVAVEGPFALAIIRDVTERKRTEEALRESEEWSRTLIRNALDLVIASWPRASRWGSNRAIPNGR
jgi:PAS domain-containing protein